MRSETKRAYEKRIAELEAKLERANDRAERKASRGRMFEHSYENLRNSRFQGENARSWAVEQAIRAGQSDIVTAAKQIADYVYGEEFDATRPEETE